MTTFRPTPTPTDTQLREAYDRSGLAETGVTFEAAMQSKAIASSLQRMTEPDRRWAATTLGRGSLRLEHLNKEDQ